MSELADLIMNSPELRWLDDAACAEMDPGDFFVDAGHTIKQEVLNVCRGCPVREQCLRHAYTHQISGGYFGGMSPGQRRTMDLAAALEFIKHDTLERARPDRHGRRR